MKSRRVTAVQRAVSAVFIMYFAAYSMGSDPQSESKGKTDHLVPVDSHIDTAYMQLLSRTLFISEANYARILVMPSTDEGEFAIAIYSQQTPDSGGDATVTCTRASKNLWYLLFQAQQSNTDVPRVPVARTDARIPKSTAVAVSKAIENMIVHKSASRPLSRSIGRDRHRIFGRERKQKSFVRPTRSVCPRSTHRSSASANKATDRLLQCRIGRASTAC
jgi:hypothetical protein